jgi:hypothetical protein
MADWIVAGAAKQKRSVAVIARDAKADEAVDIIGNEADVACTALQRVERRLGIQSQIPVYNIQLSQQRLVALCWRHRGVAAGVKADVGAGLWCRCRHDGLHLLPDPRTLVFG